jgi:perosamine synthetase
MRFKRTLPPAAAPLTWKDLYYGIRGLLAGDQQRIELEQDLKKYLGVKHVFCVNSGKTALTLILQALQTMSSKKEVVVPAYTCFSVPAAILKAGLKPRLCDVDKKTLDFNYDRLAHMVGQDTLCVISTHLFGIAADLDRLRTLCEPQRILLVEDAAQAMGGRQNDRFLGTIGDVGFYSLGRGKTITCGEGGIVVTDSDAIAQAMKHHYATLMIPHVMHAVMQLLKTFLMVLLIRPTLYWIPASIPMLKLGQTFFDKSFPMARLPGANAGLMTLWRERLAQSLTARQTVGTYFQKELDLSGVQARPEAYLRLPLMAGSRAGRDALFALSQRQGLGLSLMYPSALNAIKELRDPTERFPGAEAIADRLIALPTHAYVSTQDRQAICALVRSRAPQEGAGLLQSAQT